MSLAGFDLALSHVTALPLGGTTSLEVATVPVIVVLKMAAWLDRAAERERDLQDIAHILDDYLEPDDLRRWDDALVDSGFPHEDQSAFALGQDIARIVGSAHVTVIDAFVAAVSDEASSSNAVFARSFGTSGGTAVVAARLRAFRASLGGTG